MQVLENHQRYLSTRKHIEDYLDQVDRHIEEHDSMESLAEELDMKVAEISDYPDWRQETGRPMAAGEVILSDMETHGPHLDNILIGETRMKWALLNMSRAIRRDDEAISEEAIAAEKLLAQPETSEEREQRAELEALKFRRLQSAADNAATQEERKGIQPAAEVYEDVGRSLEELRTELGDDLEHWERAGRRRIGFTRSTQLPFAPEGAAAGEFVDAVAWMRESLDRLVSTLHPRLQRMISARN